MGKNLSFGNLVTRPQKLAFWRLPNGTYQRMEGFTDLTYSQNPKEYSRQYVDEDFERTDIVGYAPSISYAFDKYTGNAVLADIVKITENEYIGDMMKRQIVTVDLSATPMESANGNAQMRDYAVIPDTNGDTTDCLTYSGNFKAKGLRIPCIATSYDDWQTIQVTTNIEDSAKATVTITGDGVREPITDNGSTHLTGNVLYDTNVTITITADFAGAKITLFKEIGSTTTRIGTGTGTYINANNKIVNDTRFEVLVEAGDQSKTFVIVLTAVDSHTTAISDDLETM